MRIWKKNAVLLVNKLYRTMVPLGGPSTSGNTVAYCIPPRYVHVDAVVQYSTPPRHATTIQERERERERATSRFYYYCTISITGFRVKSVTNAVCFWSTSVRKK